MEISLCFSAFDPAMRTKVGKVAGKVVYHTPVSPSVNATRSSKWRGKGLEGVEVAKEEAKANAA